MGEIDKGSVMIIGLLATSLIIGYKISVELGCLGVVITFAVVLVYDVCVESGWCK